MQKSIWKWFFIEKLIWPDLLSLSSTTFLHLQKFSSVSPLREKIDRGGYDKHRSFWPVTLSCCNFAKFQYYVDKYTSMEASWSWLSTGHKKNFFGNLWGRHKIQSGSKVYFHRKTVIIDDFSIQIWQILMKIISFG